MQIKIKHLAHSIDLLGLEYARSSNSQTIRRDRALSYYARVFTQSKDNHDHVIITFVFPDRLNSIDLKFKKTDFSDDLAICEPIEDSIIDYLNKYLPDNHNLFTFLSQLK